MALTVLLQKREDEGMVDTLIIFLKEQQQEGTYEPVAKNTRRT